MAKASSQPPQFVPLEARDPELILPLIKASAVNSEDDVRLPAPDQPIAEPLAGDLHICYVFDLPGMYKFVSQKDCEALRLGPADLRPLSVRNLVRVRPRPKITQTKTCLMLSLDGDLEASLLLVGALWEQLAPRIPGDIIAAVPARDVLAVTGTDVPYGTEVLENAVKDVWSNPSPHRKLLLTQSLLIRKKTSWRVRN